MTTSIRFSHTLVHCRDKQTSATFLADVLGLDEPTPFGPFLVVGLAHDASLDFIEAGEMAFETQHYAFLVDEASFDAIFERVTRRGLDYWADPFRKVPGEVNRHDGGRGFYFLDPDGHLLEAHTRPYGSGGGS